MAHYIGKSRAHRGYVPTGEEGFYDGTNPAKMDKKEAFDLSVELPEDDPDHVAGYRMLGPNQWPDELPEMRRDVYAYYEAAMALGRTLFGGFARALGLPENPPGRWSGGLRPRSSASCTIHRTPRARSPNGGSARIPITSASRSCM